MTSATLVMNPHLYSDLPYDPKADFTPVTMASSMPMVLAVNPDFPVQTIDELTEYVRENPGQVSYAYGAAGGQIVGELYRDRAGLTGFSVPVGTPQEAIDKLHEAFAYALNTPKVRSHLEGLGQTVYAAPGDEFKERIYRDYDVLGEVIRTAGIAVN